MDALFSSGASGIAFRDFLARRFFDTSMAKSKGRRGTGYSGVITIAEPGQAILDRNSVVADENNIEVRFFIGVPARGRKIDSQTCCSMMFEQLPEIVRFSLYPENLDLESLENHINTMEDADYLRSRLDERNLTAFIADGAVLPRESGTSDKPLGPDEAVPFKAPESLCVEMDLPHSGVIRGLGIPKGITLIVGGGFHGKSTLLKAIESGIYNHIPGDGREGCVSGLNTVKIRAYSGRYIEKVDISPFINNLPYQKDTIRFSTENASGSTSQAASIMEAIEGGACSLLMDEDTCAANFMIRDRKMQNLVQKEDEPITAYIDKVKGLYENRGISTILVLGGIGDYFDVSDTVIQMRNYVPLDVTEKAHSISGAMSEKHLFEGKERDMVRAGRVPVENCVNPFNDYNKKSVYATEISRIHFGKNIIDLTDMEQLVELSQTKAMGEAIILIGKRFDGKIPLMNIINNLMKEIEENGLDVLSERISGQFSRFRSIDLACAVNRLRDLKVK